MAYTLALGVVLAVARLERPWLRVALLALLAGLQVSDATTLRNRLAAQLLLPARPWTVDATRLRPILTSHRRLILLPSWRCIPSATLVADQATELEVLTLASETTIATNTMYLARWRPGRGSCDDATTGRTPLAADEVRILLPQMPAMMLATQSEVCRQVGALTVCTAD